MIHIASRGTFAIFSFPIAGNKGGETSPISTIQYGRAQAVYIRGCAVNVQLLEQLIAVMK